MVNIGKIRSGFAYYKAGRWMEYILFSIVAIAMAFCVVDLRFEFNLLLLVASIGLGILILCFYNIQIGLYGMIGLGFLVGFLDRLVMGRFQLTSLVLMLPYLLIFIILIKSRLENKRKWIIWHPIVVFYLVTTAYLIVQLFNPQMTSFVGWISYFRGRLTYVFLMFVLMYVLTDLRKIRFYFIFIFGAIFITALYGCFQQWFGFTSFEWRWLTVDPRVLHLYSLPGGQVRTFSFLTDPANYGTLMASGGLGTLLLSFGPFKKGIKALLIASSVIIFLGMSYSGTRTAYAMLPAGLGLYILMTIYNKKTIIFSLFAGVIFLALLYLPIYGSVTLNRFRSAFQPPSEDASYNVRTIHRHMMQPYIHAHPFGGGVNTTAGPGKKYNPRHVLAGFPPDSGYFSIALQTGWVGLLFECIYFFLILFYCVHYFYKCSNIEIKTYYAVIASMLFSLMLGAYAQFTISSIPQGFVFVPFIICIIRLHAFEKSNVITQIA